MAFAAAALFPQFMGFARSFPQAFRQFIKCLRRLRRLSAGLPIAAQLDWAVVEAENAG